MEFKIFQSIASIPKETWQTLTPQDFPFADYAFFQALEKSQSIGNASGWSPIYLTLWEDQRLLAALPLFEKNHSYGEYIFDWAWAEAYRRHGLAYYPKLCSAYPLTPATGPKLLCLPGSEETLLKETLVQKALELLEKKGDSSLHFLFIPEAEIPYYQKQGFSIRHSYQYHWHQQNYKNFEDFLASLKRKRRQQIVSERNKAKKLPVEIRLFWGQDIQQEHLEAMLRFYLSTCFNKGATPYLKPSFFLEMEASLKEHCLLILAQENGEWVAGAIFFYQGKNLYGRYWGATKEYPFLHFELCYYRPLEWAIEHGIETFEAGAQGEHKILRGFLPTLTYSAHWIRHEGFRRAIDDFIEEEKKQIQIYFQSIQDSNPYLARIEFDNPTNRPKIERF